MGRAKVGGASVGIAAIMQNFEFQPRKVNGGDSHQKPSREEKFTASETSPKILKKRPSQETFVSSVAVGVSARPSPVSQDKARPKRPLAPVKLLKDREIEGGGADSCPRTHRAADVRKRGGNHSLSGHRGSHLRKRFPWQNGRKSSQSSKTQSTPD